MENTAGVGHTAHKNPLYVIAFTIILVERLLQQLIYSFDVEVFEISSKASRFTSFMTSSFHARNECTQGTINYSFFPYLLVKIV